MENSELVKIIQAEERGESIQCKSLWENKAHSYWDTKNFEYRVKLKKPRTVPIGTVGIEYLQFDAIELTSEVKTALEAAGVEY